MTFYSLQGLGNSIINFPVFHALRRARPVRVVAFENGSAAFYRAFHDDVVGVRSNRELMATARGQKTDACFTCYPTWRREIAANLLTRAAVKHVVRPVGWWRAFGGSVGADPSAHDLDNNRRLLATVPGCDGRVDPGPATFGAGAATNRTLGVHATASSRSKYYPVAFWTGLLERLADRFDHVEMYTGPAKDEIAYSEEIRSGLAAPLRARVSIAAGLDFAALTTKFAALAQFVGSDSAPVHLAALLGRPTVALWSFANYRRIYPYGNDVRIYMPRETVDAREFAYADEIPAYVARARPADVAQLIENPGQSTFNIARERGTPIGVHVY